MICITQSLLEYGNKLFVREIVVSFNYFSLARLFSTSDRRNFADIRFTFRVQKAPRFLRLNVLFTMLALGAGLTSILWRRHSLLASPVLRPLTARIGIPVDADCSTERQQG